LPDTPRRPLTNVAAEAGLLDTSVFIAREVGRSTTKLQKRVALSFITIGELQLGVLNAGDSTTPITTRGHARPSTRDPGHDESDSPSRYANG
jgi:hypothetical protein